MENIPLQQRAGRNIGNEVLPPFIHGAAMPEIAVNTNGMTVLMEGQEKVLRTPSVRVVSGNFGGIINQSSINYLATVYFVDNEGNEMAISEELDVGANDMTELNMGGDSALALALGLFLGLCPGEKIILRCAPAPVS